MKRELKVIYIGIIIIWYFDIISLLRIDEIYIFSMKKKIKIIKVKCYKKNESNI